MPMEGPRWSSAFILMEHVGTSSVGLLVDIYFHAHGELKRYYVIIMEGRLLAHKVHQAAF